MTGKSGKENKDNKSIWDILSVTDPQYTKSFTRSGGFKGTAVKPIYSIQRMTEVFGPCGQGWGTSEPKFVTHDVGTELLVFCIVELWHTNIGNKVYGIGGDKVLSVTSYGPKTNDEAYKSAFTDALANAMKHLGMSADIHIGTFDGNKYVEEDDLGDILEETNEPDAHVIEISKGDDWGIVASAFEKFMSKWTDRAQLIDVFNKNKALIEEVKEKDGNAYDRIIKAFSNRTAQIKEMENESVV